MDIKKLIEQMSLEEKASLLSGKNFWNTKAVERLGIPSMLLADGPHGLRRQTGRGDNLGLGSSLPATCYPSAAGLANSWDMELLEQLGEKLGLEAASQGVSVLLGPGVNIKRNPLCGRNFEYFSEDPYLSGKAGAAMIRGIQKNGVLACVKHFAANSQERLRMSCDSVLDERTLREIYLPAFEAAVKEGGVGCLMSSYNRVNGEYANENSHLLRDILYGEWGYEGMVVSDWGGNNDRAAAVAAGGSLEMPGSHGETDRQLVNAVREGRLCEELLDRQVEKILKAVFSTAPHVRDKSYDLAGHHAFAVKAAQEAAVLLKNEGGLLPLPRGKSLAVIGDFARRPRYQGAGSSLVNPTRLVSALEALSAEGLHIKGFAPGFRRNGQNDKKLKEAALKLAGEADIVLLFLGLPESGEAEGVDREHMALPESQIGLLREIHRINPSIAVILSCGCAVETDWDVYARALLHGYLGGQGGGTAIARLLTGKANPSGKLAETLPLRYEDTPSAPWYPGREATAEYREGIYVGYRYFETAKKPVKYPFGHGLSYTSFEYSDLQCSRDELSFTVKNTGSRPGAEVSQLYISPRTGGIFRPEKELKGFARTWLLPGEEKRVRLELGRRSFAFWSVAENDWVLEGGSYELLVGASCRDIRLSARLELEAEPVADPCSGPEFAPYYGAELDKLGDENFYALLGRTAPSPRWDRAAPLDFNSCLYQGGYLKGGLGLLIYRAISLYCRLMSAAGKKEAANSAAFIMNLPYRNLGRVSGLMTDRQVLALLGLVNREKGALRAFIRSLAKK